MLRIIALIVLALSATSAQAQPAEKFPKGTIRLVVPLAAGGNIDVAARILADRLSDQMGQRVIVENVVGAGGSIGARAVAQANPDGYTLLFQGPAQASLPFIYRKLPYDGIQGFAGVSLVGEYPLVFVINAKIPARTTAEFVALLKANPGKFNYGSSGVGGVSHLAAELFRSLAGVQIIHVPFRGNNPAMTALLAGEIHLLVDGIAAQREYIEAGSVRMLAQAPRQRFSLLPDTPTVAETVPNYDFPMWLAVFAPAKTPAPILEELSAQIAIATKDPALQKRYRELAIEPKSSSPRDMDAFFAAQLKFNEEFITRAKIQPVD
jgi:tripartite-type tricarboxylate transporter receptor subunit TctC